MVIENSLKSYLLKAVRNYCLDELRHRRIIDEHIAYELKSDSIDIDTTENYILYSDLCRQLKNALEQLPPQEREVFEMSRLENIKYQEVETLGTIVHVAVDKKYAGNIVISDAVKEDSADAIKGLKALGVRNTVMLTGDSKAVGEKIATQLGIDKVYTELLPADKVEKIEDLDAKKSQKGKIVFVGDGINDAPVLARADIGMAMGGLGSDAAIEAADIVIMTDEPSKIVTAIKVAKRTRKIVMQNIVFALAVKAIFLALGAVGVATMWEAVFADVGVTVVAVLNAMRVMNTKSI